jgi:hypothetical protein
MSGKLIGADALTHAVTGHFERMELIGPKPVPRIIASLNVDVEEFHAASAAIREERNMDEADRGPYAGGWVDGFVIGVRAARYAEQNGTGQAEIELAVEAMAGPLGRAALRAQVDKDPDQVADLARVVEGLKAIRGALR